MPILLHSATAVSRGFTQTRSFQKTMLALFAVLAIVLNGLAAATAEYSWIFSTLGTLFLLLVAKTYSAYRTDRLLELVQSNTARADALQTRLTKLQQRTVRQAKVKAKRDSKLKKCIRKLSSKTRNYSNLIEQLEGQMSNAQEMRSIHERALNEQKSVETAKFSEEQILKQSSYVNQMANLALSRAKSADAKASAAQLDIQQLKRSIAYTHWCYYLCIFSLWQDACQRALASSKNGAAVDASASFPQLASPNIKSLLIAHDKMAGHSFYRSLDDEKELILVHQMGKVGSTSIYDSLKAQDEFSSRVFHTHVLNPSGVPRGLSNLIRPERIQLHKNHFLDSLYLWNILNNSAPESYKKRWKIITLVRDPMARNVSAYFQNLNLELAFPKTIESGEIDEQEMEQSISSFFALENHKTSSAWIENQLNGVFDIDIYAEDFDREKGYSRLQKDNFDFLIIKLEKLADVHKQAFNEFLGIEDFELYSSNRAEEKRYSWIYKIFKKRISFSDEYINLIYSSTLATHFYGSDEIENLIAKWTRNRQSA